MLSAGPGLPLSQEGWLAGSVLGADLLEPQPLSSGGAGGSSEELVSGKWLLRNYVEDAALRVNQPDQNFGMVYENCGFADGDALVLKFDTEEVDWPAYDDVTVRLKPYSIGAGSHTWELYPIVTGPDWNEETVTYNSFAQGGDLADRLGDSLGQVVFDDTAAEVLWTVPAALYNGWKLGARPNYGLLAMPIGGSDVCILDGDSGSGDPDEDTGLYVPSPIETAPEVFGEQPVGSIWLDYGSNHWYGSIDQTTLQGWLDDPSSYHGFAAIAPAPGYYGNGYLPGTNNDWAYNEISFTTNAGDRTLDLSGEEVVMIGGGWAGSGSSVHWDEDFRNLADDTKLPVNGPHPVLYGFPSLTSYAGETALGDIDIHWGPTTWSEPDRVFDVWALQVDWDPATVTYAELAGGLPVAEVQGTVWEDLDGDGVRDAGEPGLSGVTIYLDLDEDGQLDAGEPAALTGENGEYALTGLEPGTYTVAEVMPSGYVQTHPAEGTHEVTVSDDEILGDIDFGNWNTLGSIGGTKWEDLDDDGVRDAGEPGLFGVTIYLDLDEDGQFDAGEPSTVTDADGNYWLTGLDPGTYTVAEVLPTGYEQTFPAGSMAFVDDFAGVTGTSIIGSRWGYVDLGVELSDWTTYPRTAPADRFEIDGDQLYINVTPLETTDPAAYNKVIASIYPVTDASQVSLAMEAGQEVVYELDLMNTAANAGHKWNLNQEIKLVLTDRANTFGDPNSSFDNYVLRVTIRPDTSATELTFSGMANSAGASTSTDAVDLTRPAGYPRKLRMILDASGNCDFYLDDMVTPIGSLIGTPMSTAYPYISVSKLNGDGSELADGSIWADNYLVKVVPDDQQPDPAGGTHEIVLSAGQVIGSIDFGNAPLPGTIAGAKWEDLDGDGIRDGGEPGLPGVTIYLDLDEDGQLDAGEPSAVTNEDGEYALTGLDPGTYAVAEVVPAEYEQTYPAGGTHEVSVSAGQTVGSVDFGNRSTLGSIGGTKWEDVDGDGVRDMGELGVSDVTIYADMDQNGHLDAGEPSAVTDGEGEYSLTGLDPGTYTVTEVVPLGYEQTFPAGGTHEVSVSAGQLVSGIDFGNDPLPATISGIKWEDLDGDGVRDAGEPGLSGVTIYADLDENGQLDVDEPSTATDANGEYSLTDLDPGTYTVAEVVPAEYEQTYPVGGTHQVVLSVGQVVDSIDFGNDPLGLVVVDNVKDQMILSGSNDPFTHDPGTTTPGLDEMICMASQDFSKAILTDWDLSGLTGMVAVGDGELRLNFAWIEPNLLVSVYELLGEPDWGEQTVTAVNFSPDGTVAGALGELIAEDVYADYGDFVYTYVTVPEATINKLINDEIAGLAITNGTSGWSNHCLQTKDSDESLQAAMQLTFQYGEATAITGTKWNDFDGDGVCDGGEPGLSGVTIYLDLDEDGQLDAGEPSTVTDENGEYALTGLDPGTYTVAEVIPADYEQTYPGGGTHEVSVSAGQTVDSVDFGNRSILGSIGGMKWQDLDGDGIRDAGEPGLAGVTIYLDLDEDGQLDAGEPSTVTAGEGQYWLTGLDPGTYTVAEIIPPNYEQTYPIGGTNEVVLSAGQVVGSVDFGNDPLPATISGTKWEDRDGDGVRDAEEPGLSGVTIYLDLDEDGQLDAGEPSATTEADGAYSFANLVPGSYLVAEVVPAEYEQTYPAGGTHEVSVSAGQNVGSVDFGNRSILGSIGGMKWLDLDGDGARDASESGLSGVTIYLDLDEDGQLDGEEPSTVTDENGEYLLTGLDPGTYTVAEVVPADYEQTYPLGGYVGDGTLTSEGVYVHPKLYANWILTVSDDGRNVYAGCPSALVVLSRDPGTGSLAFQEAYEEEMGIIDVAVSPDGHHVYATGGTTSNAVWVFERDTLTGGLAFLETVLLPGVLENPRPVVVTPDGEQVLVGASETGALLVFDRDTGTGGMDLREQVPANGAWEFAVSRDGDWVYVLGSDTIEVFARDPEQGTLSLVQSYSPPGLYSGPGDVVLSQDGNYLYVSRWKQLAALARAPDSTLSLLHLLTDVPGASGLVQKLAVGPDGGHVYTADRTQTVGVFSWDAQAEVLNPLQTMSTASISCVVMSPDGRNLYANNMAEGGVELYRRDGQSVAMAHLVQLLEGQLLSEIHFGNWALPGSITGTKWQDLDGDGVRDVGEPGLPGVTIYADLNGNGQLDAGEPASVTDGDGQYSLTGLQPRTHTVAEVVPDGYEQTYPGAGSHEVTVSIGETVNGIDFGNDPLPATITGVKWEDVDGDGIHDGGEPGLSGVTIYLDLDEDGELDAGEPSAVTHENGEYALTGLDPGTYTVAEIVPAEYEQTHPAAGTHEVTVSAGQVVGSIDFGNDPLPATIAGVKWEDVDNDGLRDAGEPGLAGVTIYLDLDEDGQPDAGEPSTVTDSNGDYSLTELDPGTYTVAEVVPADYEQTYPAGGTHEVSVSAGQTVDSIDFGNRSILGSIGGTKWQDLDGDGIRDAGEPGLAGVTIYLDLDEDGQLDAGEPSTVTAGEGQYWLTGLDPGTYTVAEIIPPNYEQTYPIGGTHEVVLSAGQVVGSIDFGNDPLPATISGTKWEDRDGDGVRDAEEPGLSGVTIYLDLDEDGQWDAGEPSTVTGADGSYWLTDVDPGSHVLSEVVPAGYEQMFPLVSYTGDGTFQTTNTLQFLALADSSRSDLVFTDDGEMAYLGCGNILAVLDRDLASGALSVRQIFEDGVGGVDGLQGVFSVDLSPDGRHVYVTGTTSEAVAIFSRDLATGDLSFQETVRIPGQIDDPRALAVTPDGANVLLGNYGVDFLLNFERDSETGSLSSAQQIPTTHAESIVVTSDGLAVYVLRASAVDVLLRDPQTGALTNVQSVDVRSEWGDIALDPTEAYLYVSATGELTVFERQADSTLSSVQVLMWAPGASAYTSHILVSPDGGHFYTSCIGIFNRNAPDGTLTPQTTVPWDAGGISLSPDGKHLYISGEGEVTTCLREGRTVVGGHAVDIAAGQELTGLDFANEPTIGITGTAWEDLNGDGVRDTGEPGLSGVTVYLDFNENGQPDATEPSAVSDADGEYWFTGLTPGTYVVRAVIPAAYEQTCPTGGTYEVFLSGDTVIKSTDFGIGPLPATISGAKWEDLDGDGVRDAGEPGMSGVTIYADLDGNGQWDAGEPSAVTDANGEYSLTGLDPGTYAVTEVVPTGYRQSKPGSEELLNETWMGSWWMDTQAVPTRFAFSPDGAHVYATFRDDPMEGDPPDGVWVFSRNADTGRLSQVQELRDGQGDLDGLESPLGIAVSPDGRHVYATGFLDNAIVTFERNAADGRLTFVETLFDGQGGVQGLYRAQMVTVSPDGQHVYVASRAGTIAVFARDLATGELTYVDSVVNGEDGLQYLTYATAISISPDGEWLYAVSYYDDAVVVFDRDTATGALSLVEQIRHGVGGMDHLEGTTALAVSPDGQNLYVAAQDTGTGGLNVFSIDPMTGVLSLLEVRTGADGLSSPRGVAVSPDGSRVYVASHLSSELLVYDREDDGTLTLASVTEGGDIPLEYPSDLYISPDNTHVYAWGYIFGWQENALFAFSHDESPGGYEVTVSAGETVAVPDFGNAPLPGTIEGSIWQDSDGDGVRDAGEAAMVATRAYLDLNHDGSWHWTEPSALTDSLGQFRIHLVAPGSYELACTAGDNYAVTFPGVGGTHSVAMNPGQTLTDLDFGLSQQFPEVRVSVDDQPEAHQYDFGPALLGEDSPATFTIHNEGEADLRISEAAGLTAPYSIAPVNSSDSGDDWTVASGGTLQFTVTFSPTSEGAFDGALVLHTNDPDESLYQIDLTGSGVTDLPGPYQTITPLWDGSPVMPGESFAFGVQYEASDGLEAAFGLGLRMHWDSSALSFDGLSDSYQYGLQPVGSPQADTSDLDADSDTDLFVTVLWVDFTVSWPGQGTTPLSLFTANFTMNAEREGETTIRFTASSTSPGYEFQSAPAEIAAFSWDLDVDANGIADALSDGIMIVRHLAGLPPEAVAQGAADPQGARTDPAEIAAYIDQGVSTFFDLDGIVSAALDVDASGHCDALTDGIMIVRHLAGLPASAVVEDAMDPAATRTDPLSVAAYIDAFASSGQTMQSPLTGTSEFLAFAVSAPGAVSDPASQILYGSPTLQPAGPDEAVQVTAVYTTNTEDETLTGLGLRIHWDSSQLLFQGATDAYAFGLQPMGDPQVDDEDLDGDPATDRYLTILWLDLSGSWPGVGSTPAVLVAVDFLTSSDFEGPTPVRFSASATAAGYEDLTYPAWIGAPAGDVSVDGTVNQSDIDLLFANLGSADPIYDPNGDGVADAGDVQYLVEEILGTHPGDANLDGVVADSDYTIWADHYQQPDVGWADGDFNGDGSVTDADYTLWADHYGATATLSTPNDAPSPGSGQVLSTDSEQTGYRTWAENYGATAATVVMGDFNGDGAVSDADYTIWADNYGAGIASASAAETLQPVSAKSMSDPAAVAQPVVARRAASVSQMLRLDRGIRKAGSLSESSDLLASPGDYTLRDDHVWQADEAEVDDLLAILSVPEVV